MLVSYRDLIGVPYKVHGRSIEDGLDCYGLAIEVLRRNGIRLDDVIYSDNDEDTKKQIIRKIECEKLEKPQECCIIEITCYGVPSHIGVYIGNGQMIHTTESTGVCIVPLHLYKNRIRGMYKVNTRL